MLIFKQLYDFTRKFKSWRAHYPDVDSTLVDIIPNVKAKLLTFRYRVKSQTKRNEGYNVWIQFYNVEFDTKPISSTSVKIINKATNEPLYFERISLTEKARKNYVRVRCGCADFRFRFAWEDRDAGCLYGGVPKGYTPVPGSNRPPVNPDHIPGMCKHIFMCAKGSEHFFMR